MKLAPLFAASLALLFACDDDERRRPWDTHLDDDATVSNVSRDDKRDACRSLEANLDVRLDFTQLTRLLCLPSALLRAGGSTPTCQLLVDQCAANNTPPPLLVGARVDMDRCVSALDRCDGRVGALESCVNLNVSGLVDLIEQLSCGGVGDPAMLDRARTAMERRGTLTTCADLSSACQDFVSDVVVQ